MTLSRATKSHVLKPGHDLKPGHEASTGQWVAVGAGGGGPMGGRRGPEAGRHTREYTEPRLGTRSLGPRCLRTRSLGDHEASSSLCTGPMGGRGGRRRRATKPLTVVPNRANGWAAGAGGGGTRNLVAAPQGRGRPVEVVLRSTSSRRPWSAAAPSRSPWRSSGRSSSAARRRTATSSAPRLRRRAARNRAVPHPPHGVARRALDPHLTHAPRLASITRAYLSSPTP